MNKNHRSSRQARSERTSNRGQNARTKPPVDSYFVCGTPRTGSSLLLGLLESTGVADRPQAYFREPDEPLWADRWQVPRAADGGFNYADYVRAALAAGRTGNGVFGAKLMWGTLDELVVKLGRVFPDHAGDDAGRLERAFGRSGFVFLRRADVVAQAVSWLRAERTGTWYVGGNGIWPAVPVPGRCPAGSDPAPCPQRLGVQAVLRVITAFSRPGDRVVIPEPGTGTLAVTVAAAGCRALAQPAARAGLAAAAHPDGQRGCRRACPAAGRAAAVGRQAADRAPRGNHHHLTRLPSSHRRVAALIIPGLS